MKIDEVSKLIRARGSLWVISDGEAREAFPKMILINGKKDSLAPPEVVLHLPGEEEDRSYQVEFVFPAKLDALLAWREALREDLKTITDFLKGLDAQIEEAAQTVPNAPSSPTEESAEKEEAQGEGVGGGVTQ